MVNKMNILIRLFIMVLLPAFILRPVVVCVHNSSSYQNLQDEIGSFSHQNEEISVPHTTLRHIAREAPDSVVLVPCITKAKAPSFSDSRISLVFAPGNSSPQSFLILRI